MIIWYFIWRLIIILFLLLLFHPVCGHKIIFRLIKPPHSPYIFWGLLWVTIWLIQWSFVNPLYQSYSCVVVIFSNHWRCGSWDSSMLCNDKRFSAGLIWYSAGFFSWGVGLGCCIGKFNSLSKITSLDAVMFCRFCWQKLGGVLCVLVWYGAQVI